MNRAADRYKLRVKRSLFCGRADRDRLLNQFAEMLDDFQQTKPDADYAEYTATFGEPAACAGELLSSLGESKLEASRKRRRWLCRGVYAAILAVFALLSVFLYYKYDQSMEFNEDTVVVIDPVISITEEEANTFIEQTPIDARSYGEEEK